MNKKKALVIGIDNYRSSPLRGCISDAKSVAALLAQNDDESGSVNFDVISRFDVLKRDTLLDLIEELFKGKAETALLYFSGHGHLDALGGHILAADSRSFSDAERVSMNEILNLTDNPNIDNKIIILDCCHSGAMGDVKTQAAPAAHLNAGITILTASRDTEKAIEINGRGVFTNLLIDALDGGAADLRGHITPGSVYAYIDQALGPWSQRPIFKTNVESFTSLRNVKPAVPIVELRRIPEFFPQPQEAFPLDPSYEYTNTDVAVPERVAIFKILQRFEGVGLVVPVGEEHMYWAAQNGKSCKLTALGYHYWHLVKDKRF